VGDGFDVVVVDGPVGIAHQRLHELALSAGLGLALSNQVLEILRVQDGGLTAADSSAVGVAVGVAVGAPREVAVVALDDRGRNVLRATFSASPLP
jgi:hypothetical protein